MQVVTFVTDKSHPHFRDVLVPSCRGNRLDLVVLTPHPATMKLEGLYRYWAGRLGYSIKFRFLRKYKAMRRYLKTLPQDELLLFTDAYDAVMLAPPDEIIDKYRSFEKPIVFSAEKSCHPPGNVERFPPSSTSLRFLNSGGYMGAAGALLDAYERIAANGYVKGRSDQLAWQQLYLDCPDLISLDYQATMFLCLAVGASKVAENTSDSPNESAHFVTSASLDIHERVVFEEKRAVYVETGQRPCQLHFNGKSRRLLTHEYMRPVTVW
jgi:hypothetical protein